MAARYRVVLAGAKANANKIAAQQYLGNYLETNETEVSGWLSHLPHTLTTKATQYRAQELKKILEDFGYVLEISPELDGLEPSSKDSHFVVPSIQTPRRFLNPSILAIFGIAFVFSISLIFVLVLLQKEKSPGNPKKETLARASKNDDFFLQQGIQKFQQLRRIGNKQQWKGHLISDSWDQPIEELPNYFKSELGESTLRDFLRAIEYNSANLEARLWLAKLYLERDEPALAVSQYQYCLKLKGNSTDILNALAQAHIQNQEPQSALKSLLRALKIDNNNPITLKSLGNLYRYTLNDSQKALKYYLHYLNQEHQKDFERPIIRKEVVRLKLSPLISLTRKSPLEFEEFERRRTQWEKEYSRDPKTETLNKLANLYYQQRKWREAEIYYLRSLQKDKKQIPGYAELARLYIEKREYPRALDVLTKAYKNNSINGEILYTYAVLEKYYREDKKFTKELLREYLALGDSRFRDQVYRELEGL